MKSQPLASTTPSFLEEVFRNVLDAEGRMRFVIARPVRSLKRLHRPNLLAFDYKGFKDRKGVKILLRSNPVCPQHGPYEASKGI